MIHPLSVNYLEKDYSLDFSYLLSLWEECLFILIEFNSLFLKIMY